jgi:hypothetical protein
MLMMQIPSGKKFSLLTLIFLALLSLHGCGGSRDEPFDPGDDDDDDEDLVTVNMTLLVSGTSVTLMDTGNKRLQVMTTEEEYYDLLDQYTDEVVEEPNFDEGQVVLYDAGFIDDNPCAHKLRFRRASAAEGDTYAKVTLEYEDFQPQTGSDCTDNIVTTRPFRFMFVESLEKIIFEEQIQRSSSSRSSSSSQSSSSSSFSSSSPGL